MATTAALQTFTCLQGTVDFVGAFLTWIGEYLSDLPDDGSYHEPVVQHNIVSLESPRNLR